jgi:MFS transporter, DHA3 family, macrolide efflux protein
LGGILIGFFGQSVSIVLASVFLLVAAFFASRLPSESGKSAPVGKTSFEHFMSDVSEGYHLLKTSPAIKFPVALIIFLQIFITVISIIFPSFTNESLGLSLYHAGTILVIPGVIGALAATFALPRTLRYMRKKQIIEYGILTSGLSLLAMSFGVFLPPLLRIIFSMVSAVGLGVSVASALVPANTLLQEQTPPEFRGRVYGVLGFFMTISTSLPLMVASSLADVLGTQIIMILMGLFMISAYIFIKINGDALLQGKSVI